MAVLLVLPSSYDFQKEHIVTKNKFTLELDAHRFINYSLALASAALAVDYALLGRIPFESSVVNPFIIYIATSALIVIIIRRSSITDVRFRDEFDALPPLIFAGSAFLSGIRDSWIYIFLAIIVIYNVVIMIDRRDS